MGFFKDLNKLTKQSKELGERVPAQNQWANMQNSVAQANAMMANMAASAAATTAAMTNGVDAFATVTSAAQTGTQINHQPVIDLELMVMMPSGVPVPVRRQETVQMIHLARCAPGQRLKVKVDSANANSLWIDWATPA